ncbi:hypothetical protein TrRE_jg9658, partial [Triparma retinervis]
MLVINFEIGMVCSLADPEATIQTSRDLHATFDPRTGEMSTIEGIQVVDFEGLVTGAGAAEAVEAVLSASKSSGIFYLTNCGLLCSLSGQTGGLDFYNSSLFRDDVRSDLGVRADASNSRGYIVEGGEAGVNWFVERKEGFEYGDDGGTGNKANKWPEGAERRKMNIVFEEMQRIKNALMELVFSNYLGEEVMGREGWEGGRKLDLIRVFRYIACASDEGGKSLGSSPHTDWGLLTLILQEAGSVPALQYRDSRGVWRDVPPVRGSVVVNAGDTLELLSNVDHAGNAETLKSPVHRVQHCKEGGGGGM